jgi:arylsulfatase A-like enzyme
MWNYVLGVSEYTPEELALMASTYDATLTELDLLFDHLLTSLEKAGMLKNTVIVLTADHGEHLGEHHLLDHQYSLYRPLINVPLIIHYPKRFPAGRDASPVMNFDLFPTLLELAGVDSSLDGEGASKAHSLLKEIPDRQRMSQYPEIFKDPFRVVAKKHPDWDRTPWNTRLFALQEGKFKIICGKASGPELYDVVADPEEKRESAKSDPDRVKSMSESLHQFLASTRSFQPTDRESAEMTAEQRERLEALGYVIDDAGSETAEPILFSATPCASP